MKNDYLIKSGCFSSILKNLTYSEAEARAKTLYKNRSFEILLITPWGAI